MNRPLAFHWAVLERHFRHHARMVHLFRDAGRDAVIGMWLTQTNEDGERLSQFEREALMERHCELFGTWPDLDSSHFVPKVRYRIHSAEPELVDPHLAEGARRIANLCRRIAKLERLGGDTQLPKRLLVTFGTTLQLMIAQRGGRVWTLTGTLPN